MKKITEAPETIYLQWHGEADADDINEVSTEDVTWAAERIFSSDVKYQRTPQWHSTEDEVPEDGDFLTLIVAKGRMRVEVAPWRDGRYQGSCSMCTNLGIYRVIAWMQIPPINDIIQNIIGRK